MAFRTFKTLVLLDTANKQLVFRRLAGSGSSPLKTINLGGEPLSAVSVSVHTLWVLSKSDQHNTVSVYAIFPSPYFLYVKNITVAYDRMAILNSSVVVATKCATDGTPVLIDLLQLKYFIFIRSVIRNEYQSKRFGCPVAVGTTSSGDFRIADSASNQVVSLSHSGDYMWSYDRDWDSPVALAVNSKSQVFVSYKNTADVILLSERGKFLQVVFEKIAGMPIRLFAFGETENEMFVIRGDTWLVYQYRLTKSTF